MSEKSGYEVRLELLQLANSIISQPIKAQRESLVHEFHISRETFPGEAGPRNPLEFPTLPEYPSVTEIIKTAEDLYRFVEQKYKKETI